MVGLACALSESASTCFCRQALCWVSFVERKRCSDSSACCTQWDRVTDGVSAVLLLTAIQAPILQQRFGASLRSEASIGLKALLLPLRAIWLAGMALAYHPEATDKCLTQRVLSLKPLIALGHVLLVLHYAHLAALFCCAPAWPVIATGGWHVMLSDYSLTHEDLLVACTISMGLGCFGVIQPAKVV